MVVVRHSLSTVSAKARHSVQQMFWVDVKFHKFKRQKEDYNFDGYDLGHVIIIDIQGFKIHKFIIYTKISTSCNRL